MSTLALSIQQVQERIKSASLRVGRKPEGILLVAVTKTVSAENIHQAIQQGLTHFGENYIQEAQRKIETLRQGDWHFIGHLQTNKAKQALKLFSMIETLDSQKLARELNHQALQVGKIIDVLIQVNEAGESTKSGLTPDQVPALLKESPAWPGLRIRGLMTIPPYHPDPERSRPWYRSLYHWQEKWQQEFPEIDLAHISMGMSHDFEVAIEEGATIIRVGTALFGAREKQ
jgi:PLP dependent protein